MYFHFSNVFWERIFSEFPASLEPVQQPWSTSSTTNRNLVRTYRKCALRFCWTLFSSAAAPQGFSSRNPVSFQIDHGFQILPGAAQSADLITVSWDLILCLSESGDGECSVFGIAGSQQQP